MNFVKITTITVLGLLLGAGGELRADLQGGTVTDRDRGREQQRLRGDGPEGIRSSSLPPLPQDASAEVQRGQQVAVILNARGKHGETVEFLLREMPAHGDLSEMRRLTLNSVEVVYTHSGENLALNDSFTYAARSRGTPISARATVTITILERPGELEVPETLAFGEVVAGETASRTLTLTNSGTGALTTGLRLPPGFRITTGSTENLVLPAGEELPLELVFAPEMPGGFRDPVLYTDAPGVYTMLTATAVPPLEVPVDTLELKRVPEGIAGKISVKNRSSSPRSVKARTLRPLVVTPAIVVAPGETGTLEVTAPGAHPEGFEEVVKIEGDHFEQGVTVSLAPLPAVLAVPETLEIRENDATGQSLRVKNEGGLPFPDLNVEFSPPWFIAQGPEFPLDLLPSAELELRIGHSGETRGHDDAPLKFLSGDSLVGTVELIAVAAPPPAPAAERAAPAATSSASAASSRSVSNNTAPAARQPAAAALSLNLAHLREVQDHLRDKPLDPPAHDFRLLERGRRQARVEFLSRGEPDFDVEIQVIRPGSAGEPPEIGWQRWAHAEIVQRDGKFLLVLKDLPEAPTYFRLTGRDHVLSRTFRIPAAPPSAGLSLVWWIVGICAVGGAAWWIRRRQMA